MAQPARGNAASRLYRRSARDSRTARTALQRGTSLARRSLDAPRNVAALVVAVDTDDPRRPLEPELVEFEALAHAAGARILDRIVQRREAVDPGTLVGSGKAREIADRARELDAGLLLVLNDLRPRQRKSLEKIVPLPIVDRTMLILDVFARHARSREGKLQVELAQLRYRQSNLIGIGADLSRLGGGIGTRGPGETKLEVDRRAIGARISVLRRQLEGVRRQRAVRRAGDRREPLVALVGYTNAGKSSLLNALARSDAFVADQPFATLDPTIRRVYLSPQHYVRVADTVGFITDLPKDLVNAFRATLEELREADLLIHVIDASNPDWPRQRVAVDSILHDLELDKKPRLQAFNKIDLVPPATRPHESGASLLSAVTGFGLAELRAALANSFPVSP
ncbi:MAG: GTPase HflX [Candidatus Eremiobacteraeota bacterium]|nr:GTPase HflX [Candidatus Eremiobacteraeota bacterium]